MINISQEKQQQLFEAFTVFIKGFRAYLSTTMRREFGSQWLDKFIEAQNDMQRGFLEERRKQAGVIEEDLIDYQFLRNTVIRYRDMFRLDFERQTNQLQTRIEDIVNVRNKTSHFQPISQDEASAAFIAMRNIASSIKMTELTEALAHIEQANLAPRTQAAPWYQHVTPHEDIKYGRLDESIFAANLGEVANGTAPRIYTDAELFFKKTYASAGLKTIARRVVAGLNGGQDAENRVVSLQTGFGGGKTHTLITLYHLARNGNSAAAIGARSILDGTDIQFAQARTAVFTNTTNDPMQGRWVEEGITLRTLWGELAYQLGGREAYELIRANDESRTAPKGLFKRLLQAQLPALILIDELADYCVSAAAIAVGASTLSDQTISFMQELTESVASIDKCVLIATLPASDREVAASDQASQILRALENRITRVGAQIKPVEDEEIFEVVRLRLFEDLGDMQNMENAVAEYMKLYKGIEQDLPSYALKSEYKERLRKAYPFHPELIDMFRLRWASHHAFQRTRGVLRLLAAIVADIWRRREALVGSQYFIHTSDVVFQNLDQLTGQIVTLHGPSWNTVIAADVAGTASNASRIDNNLKDLAQYKVAQGIAATLLLGSFGSTGQNKGVSLSELKLCIVKPNSFSHNDINAALDKLEANAHYLYYSSATANQKKYWFDTIPNINILVNEAKAEADKSPDFAYAEIVSRIRTQTKGANYNTLVDINDTSEAEKFTIVFMHPQFMATQQQLLPATEEAIKTLATKRGGSDRAIRNAMLFVVPLEQPMSRLKDLANLLWACDKVAKDYNTQLTPEQRKDLSDRKQQASTGINTYIPVAYSLMVKYSLKAGPNLIVLPDPRQDIGSQINAFIEKLKSEELYLESVGAQILKDNNLWPQTGKPVQVKAAIEAFLRFDDKPFIASKDHIRNSLQNFVLNGRLAMAYGDSSNFSKYYFKEKVEYLNQDQDGSYYLIDAADMPKPEPVEQPQADTLSTNQTYNPQQQYTSHHTNPYTNTNPSDKEPLTSQEPPKPKVKSLHISGPTASTQYSELLRSFILPIIQAGGRVDIKVDFNIHATDKLSLDSNSELNARLKEAARQFGLDFEENF